MSSPISDDQTGDNFEATPGSFYLQPNVKFEPLVCGWYAWAHLISPLQLGMNLAFRYVPLLRSFINNTSVHLAAALDPTLFGGPFVHLPENCVPAVEQLLNDTLKDCTKILALAQSAKTLDVHLQSNAKGHSLKEFYLTLPPMLRGLVELAYDLNNHPIMRVHERLLYEEDFFPTNTQVMLSQIEEDQRPFFMSTPRLKISDSVSIRTNFSDTRLDRLAAMRTQPDSLEEITRLLRVAPEDVACFQRLFTKNTPNRNAPHYGGTGVRMRYFGHACVLLQTARTSILVDPVLSFETGKHDNRFTFNDLPDHLDLIVLSHSHLDHFSPEMLIQLRHRARRVVVPRNSRGSISDPSIKLVLERLGFTNVDVVDPFDRVEFTEGQLTSLPFSGEHGDLDIHSRHGIHIEFKGRRFAFLVDSDGIDTLLLRRTRRSLGLDVDALFIGMECHGAPMTWLYGPLLTNPIARRDDESRRLSGLTSERAWATLQEFPATRVFVYALGQEPWLQYMMGLKYTPDSIQLRECAAFLARCEKAGIVAERLYIRKEIEF